MLEETDKEWARKYILDPLTAPEPSQETGPGTSHYNQLRGSLAYGNVSQQHQPTTSRSASQSHKQRQHRGKLPESIPIRTRSSGSSNYPTPPSSASPTRSNFHPSNPYFNKPVSARSSPPRISPPTSPERGASAPVDDKRNHPRYYPPSASARHVSTPPPPYVQRESSLRHRGSGHSSRPSPREVNSARNESSASPQSHQRPPSGHRRNRSLSQRFPGDMSHRPLDVIKQENRVADRAQHTGGGSHRHRRNITETDTIDALDTIGGTYHHGGPYDATLISRNLNKKYSPVDAVRESNMEAIRATPREFIQDSLQRHIPLQGTATVPAGETDLGGNVMEYQEGADLMRETDAPGGAYKRWDGIQYHPDDLKGKGEPFYTFEKDAKEHKRRLGNSQPGEIEMVSNPGNSTGKPTMKTRQRSVSNAAAQSSGVNADGDLRRSHSTGGKKLSEGLKRRFGSIRRKVHAEN